MLTEHEIENAIDEARADVVRVMEATAREMNTASILILRDHAVESMDGYIRILKARLGFAQAQGVEHAQ